MRKEIFARKSVIGMKNKSFNNLYISDGIHLVMEIFTPAFKILVSWNSSFNKWGYAIFLWLNI